MLFKLLIMLVVLTLASCNGLTGSQKEALSKANKTLSSFGDEAQQWAGRIKSDYGKGDPQYEGAYSKYIPAKAAVNSWIDQLLMDLTTGKDITESKQYDASVREASEKAESFITYCSKVYDQFQPQTLGAVSLGLADLTKAGLEIWEAFRKASREQIEEVKKELEERKWKPFDKT